MTPLRFSYPKQTDAINIVCFWNVSFTRKTDALAWIRQTHHTVIDGRNCSRTTLYLTPTKNTIGNIIFSSDTEATIAITTFSIILRM